MTAATALLGSTFVVVACYAAGTLLLDLFRISSFLRRSERIPLGFLLGASAVHLWMFVLLALQIAYWPVIVLPLAGIAAWSLRTGCWKLQGQGFSRFSPYLYGIAGIPAAAFFIVYFAYAWAPEHSADGSEYHLWILARQLRNHGFEQITTNFYAMLGQGVELVFLPAFAIGQHSAAALTHLAFAVALGLAIFSFGRRKGFQWVGATAALLTFLSPVFGNDASIAYVDAGAAAIMFAAFYWLEIWDGERGAGDDAWRLLIPAGLMAGYAVASKYTGFTIAIYAVGFVLFRARRLKPVLLTTACAILMGGPWVARNWILYDNPAAPMGTAIFRNPHTHVYFEEKYREYFAYMGVENKRELALEVTVHGLKTGEWSGLYFCCCPWACSRYELPWGVTYGLRAF